MIVTNKDPPNAHEEEAVFIRESITNEEPGALGGRSILTHTGCRSCTMVSEGIRSKTEVEVPLKALIQARQTQGGVRMATCFQQGALLLQ